MLCVWWNFEGIINHFELVQNGAVNTALYSELLDGRVDAARTARRYPALIDRKDAFLQHDNGPAAHTAAALIKAKIQELPSGIKFLPNPA